MRAFVLLVLHVAAALAQQSGVFNPSSFYSGHGPAVPPSSYLSTASPLTTASASASNASSSSHKTLVSASHASASSSSSIEESIVTSTVDGSVTTVTVTNTGALAEQTGGSNAAGREKAVGWAAAAAVAGAMGAAWTC
ncbi:hypothetical protein JCM10213v2_004649 [Rhodosporidiobolus nylandii]